jgi:DNA-binding XRE family transcriptional regulator
VPARDDLDQLIDDFAVKDPGLGLRVAAALERRELARELAGRRRESGLTQTEVAERMGTSQGQVARFESGADTRLSTVARYAAALGVTVSWSVQRAPAAKRPSRAAANRVPSA